MKHSFVVYLLLTAVLLWGCKRYPSGGKSSMPEQYATAYQEIYGHCYDSIDFPVVALDLYDEGLYLTNERRMAGTGYNLYLSDIFVPDSLLAAGEYTTLSPATDTPAPFTFLPGHDWEGTPTGIYLLYVEEGVLQSIQLIDSGRMVVKAAEEDYADIDFTFYYRDIYGYKSTYNTSFKGTLLPVKK